MVHAIQELHLIPECAETIPIRVSTNRGERANEQKNIFYSSLLFIHLFHHSF